MTFETDPNHRRLVDADTQRRRDAEVARMRRAGEPFRTIAARLDMSLGVVQKSLRRAQKLADAIAAGQPGDVVAAVCDDELKCYDVQTECRPTQASAHVSVRITAFGRACRRMPL